MFKKSVQFTEILRIESTYIPGSKRLTKSKFFLFSSSFTSSSVNLPLFSPCNGRTKPPRSIQFVYPHNYAEPPSSVYIRQHPSHTPHPQSRRKIWHIGERGPQCYEDGRHIQCHDEIAKIGQRTT